MNIYFNNNNFYKTDEIIKSFSQIIQNSANKSLFQVYSDSSTFHCTVDTNYEE